MQVGKNNYVTVLSMINPGAQTQLNSDINLGGKHFSHLLSIVGTVFDVAVYGHSKQLSMLVSKY